MLRERKGVVLKWVPVTDDGVLDLEAFQAALGPRTKVVAVLVAPYTAAAIRGPAVWPARAAPTHTATTAPRCSGVAAPATMSCSMGMNTPSPRP